MELGNVFTQKHMRYVCVWSLVPCTNYNLFLTLRPVIYWFGLNPACFHDWYTQLEASLASLFITINAAATVPSSHPGVNMINSFVIILHMVFIFVSRDLNFLDVNTMCDSKNHWMLTFYFQHNSYHQCHHKYD